MTPKEKATELVNRFSKVGLQQREEGIECALICADEVLKSQELENYHFNAPDFVEYMEWTWDDAVVAEVKEKFWKEVKIELKKLMEL
jgi:hypothetical protein